jgi:acyl-CoA hydrolase
VFAGPRDPRAPGSLVGGNVIALLDSAAAARL